MVSIILVALYFSLCIVWCIVFCYYAVSMNDTSNHNMCKSVAKCQQNCGEFHGAFQWSS